MSKQTFPGRIGWLVIIALIIAGVYFLGSPFTFKASPAGSPSAVSQAVDDLPSLADKPQPSEVTFLGCPPQGQGGDTQLNVLKNRVDQGNYISVAFDSLVALRWPKSTEQQVMNDWSTASLAFISQYQGMPIVLEGYLLSAKEAPPDPANCNRNNGANVDWNLSISKTAGDDPSLGVMAQITPRIRAGHKWTLDAIRTSTIFSQAQVRISGWLLFNSDHPGEVGRTRATLWEIHPVMEIEVLQNGHWISLDKLSP
jgi:hypothetical protein